MDDVIVHKLELTDEQCKCILRLLDQAHTITDTPLNNFIATKICIENQLP